MKTIEDHIEFDKKKIEDPTTSPYNDGWTQEFYKDKLKAKGITTTKINIAVPEHPDYTELDD